MKIKNKLERIPEIMFDEKIQAKAIIVVFGILGIICLIGALWNPKQLLLGLMCGMLVLCGNSELKKIKKHENKKRGE